MSDKQATDSILLGRIIKHARLMSGNGLRAFANAIGIVPSRLNEIERGESFAADEELQSISDEIERTWQAGIAWRERIVNERDSLESELASLREQLKAAEERADKGFDEQSVLEWQRLPSRPDAALAFTEGRERKVATLIEIERIACNNKLAGAERENARLREGIKRVACDWDRKSSDVYGLVAGEDGKAIRAVVDGFSALLAQPEEVKDGT